VENSYTLHERLILALICAVILFPAGYVLLGFGSLLVADGVSIGSDVPGLLYVAMAAGLASVGLLMFALTAATQTRSQAIGWVALGAFVVCVSAGIAGLHELEDRCGGSGRAGLECSDD
jgi:hypothetical protein